ncbi:MAG: Lrp/AsnC family transcriptional regulator [Acidobacteriota bacterium]
MTTTEHWNIELDELDLRILRQLQEDSAPPSAALARELDMSAPGLAKRLRKLAGSGVVRREVVLLDRLALGLDVLCFVQVTLTHHQLDAVQGFRTAIDAMPEVLECHHLTGEFDYLLKVVCRNHRDLESFLVERLTPTPGVDRIRTSIVLREEKSTTALPLSESSPTEARG